jgi:seryl-tRNA synthetase
VSFGAQEVHYSALIASEVLEQAEYPRAFPHLLLSASQYQTTDQLASLAQRSMQAATEWCLSPAVCYHVYAHLAGSTLLEPQVLTSCGTCFRYESERAPGVRQV